MTIVILAGGGGTRLWPLSRQAKPKQFQKIIADSSLLALTRQRLGTTYPDDAIYISVGAPYVEHVRAVFPDFPSERLLIEPEKRDTGPAMGFVAAVLALTKPDEPLAFLPSDHYIADTETFLRCLRVAEELIRETGCLLDIGVTPAWPSADLGYTRIGQRHSMRDGVEVLTFRGHTEKPQRAVAEQFLAAGDYLWHANYYMWTPRKFLHAYEQHQPATYTALCRIQELWQRGDHAGLAAVYRTLPKIAIDYAITEKLAPEDVLILKAPFDWSDVGQWASLKQLREENAHDVVVEGARHVGIDSSDCIIYGPANKLITTIGMERVVIVDTGDALLVCDKDRAEEVKLLVEKLQEEQLPYV